MADILRGNMGEPFAENDPMRRARSLIQAALIAALSTSIALPNRQADACGYDGPYITQAEADRDAALARFAAGDIGLFSPTWKSSYLIASYRWLEGTPLTAEEQAGLKAMWGDGSYRSAVGEWRTLRGQVRGDQAPAPATHRSNGEYSYYLNCTDDAFDTARQTLTDRMRVYRTQPGHYLEWLRGQDAVFSNCGGGEQIPPELTASAPLLLRKDREYQIAAALFYAGKFDEARKAFDAIAGDRTSPWQGLGAYLAVRAMVRSASLEGGDVAKTLEECETRLGTLLTNSDLKGIHPAARNLLALVRYRHDPAKQVARLAAQVASGKTQGRFVNMVRDIRQALVAVDYGELQLEAGVTPVVDWLMAARRGTHDGGYEMARAGFAQHGGDAWLVLALSLAEAQSAGVEDLLVAARKVTQGSRAEVSVRFHHARLLGMRGDRSGARAVLSALSQPMPKASENAVHALRMALADTYRSWKQSALRSSQGKAVLMADARTDVRERFSLPMMLKLAALPGADDAVRREVLMAGLVRSLARGERGLAKRFARALLPMAPDLAADLKVFIRAKAGHALGIGALVVFRHDNAFGEPSYRGALDDYSQSCGTELFCQASNPAQTAVVEIPGIRSRVGAQAKRTSTRLDALGGHIEAFSVRYPKHELAPEALHRLVRATRRASMHGTSTARTAELSKGSFKRLQKTYEGTQWAKDTRYWYR